MTDYRDVRTTTDEQGRTQRFATFKATQMIWLLLGLLEAVIALRVVFKLIGVNAANPFAAFLYSVTYLFVAPFASLVRAPAAEGMVLEISSIIAMIVYLLIAWGIERIVYVLFYRPQGPVSVRQTTVSDHTPLQAPTGVSQTTTTDRSTTQAPSGTSQTTVSEHTNTQTPGSL
jgi:YGGT family